MSWETVKLDDAATLLIGSAFKSSAFLDADSEGVKLLRGDNVQQGYIRWGDKTKRWPSNEYDDFDRYQLDEGDVILAMDRPIVGDGLKFAWITKEDLPALLVQRVCCLRGKADVTLTSFLRYVLADPKFSAHIHKITTGANIPHISGKDIAAYEFHQPGINEQKNIVSVLSAYDDLIAANQRRIQLLEESARLLYREWFVKLRFPGHETVQVVDGVPEGWDTPKLADIADVNNSAITAKEHPESIRYVDISSVETGEIGDIEEISFDEAPGRARRKVKHGDVIWSCVRPNRRSYALIWEPEDNFIVSTGFAVLSACSVPFSYLYLAATTDDFVSYLTNQATGAAYPAVTAKDFEKATIIRPDAETLKSFDMLALPIQEQVDTIKNHNKQLRQARDLLLPKLMSGALDVSRMNVPVDDDGWREHAA